MSGETEREVSGWTTDTLKEMHDREIGASRRLGGVLIGSLAVIVALGWHEIQRRLITLNHAHEQHEDVLARSVTSEKYESDKKAEETRIGAIESRLVASDTRERTVADESARAAGARAEQKSDTSGVDAARRQTIALLISLAAVIITIVGLYALRQKPTVVIPNPVPATTTSSEGR